MHKTIFETSFRFSLGGTMGTASMLWEHISRMQGYSFYHLFRHKGYSFHKFVIAKYIIYLLIKQFTNITTIH